MIVRRVLNNPLNGRFTSAGRTYVRVPGGSYEGAKPQKGSNYWSSTEYNANNAWNVNFNNGNVNNNNKYNGNVARAVAAYDGLADRDFYLFFKSVVEAYDDCMRGKRTSPQAVDYMQLAAADLVILAWEMWTGTYAPGVSTCFLVKYPTIREVFAAAFRDRIVHHWICLRIVPLYEERFEAQGNVSFNCRKGYGTQKAVEAVAAGFKRVSDNYTRQAWVFKGDISGFFMSICKSRLWYLMERFTKRRYHGSYKDILLHLSKVTVLHHPERHCVLNTPREQWKLLSPKKSMFTCGEDRGEPIGNLTTQHNANFYMSFFDAYVAFLFRGSNYDYERFVDDFEVSCDDKKFLLKNIPKMEAFLRDVMILEMHKDKRYIQPVSHGIKFVGTVIKPNRTYLADRTIARFMERIHGFNELLETKPEVSALDCQRIEQVLNSYLGFCRPHRTYRIRREAIGLFGRGFWRRFYVRGHYESVRVRPKYRMLNLPFQCEGA